MEDFPLPAYKSHKIVRAAKITALRGNGNDDMPDLVLGEIGAIVALLPDWHAKHKPQVGGYYVQYEDGYNSYSPAKAFEEGYTALASESDAAEKPKPAIAGYRVLSTVEIDLINAVKEQGANLNLLIERVRNHLKLQKHIAQGGSVVTADGGDGADDSVAERKTYEANVDEVARLSNAEPERWASIGRTHFQEGLMALTRAVAQPTNF